MYSPTLGRFIQPDSIVPGAGNPQAYNRYSYVLNDPINLGSGYKVSDTNCFLARLWSTINHLVTM
jgi:hypothetical protein